MCLFPPFLCTIPAVVNPWDIIDYSMRNQTDLEKSVASISLRTSLWKIVLPTDLGRKDSKIIIDEYTYSMLLIEWIHTHTHTHTHTHPASLCLSDKESACQCRNHRRHRFDPWVRKIPWRRRWQPTPVFLPGESHRQRSLASYSPQGHKRVGHNCVTEHTCLHMPWILCMLLESLMLYESFILYFHLKVINSCMHRVWRRLCVHMYTLMSVNMHIHTDI